MGTFISHVGSVVYFIKKLLALTQQLCNHNNIHCLQNSVFRRMSEFMVLFC